MDDAMDFPDDLEDLEDVPVTISVGKSKAMSNNFKDSMNDLYSTHRYTLKEEWRVDGHESANIQEMHVKAWKSEHALLAAHEKVNTTKISSADAQLVHFLNYNYHHSTGNRDNYDLMLRYRGLTSRYALQRSSLFPKEGVHSIPLLLGDGTMAYINTKISLGCTEVATNTKKPLLGRPIQDLMHHVDMLERRALKRKRKALENDVLDETKDVDTTTAGPDDFEIDSVSGNPIQEPISIPLNSTDSPSQLWVDSYSPKQFSDLLSDEKINREVLRALREWDPYVFRKKAPTRHTPNPSSYDSKGYKKSTHANAPAEPKKRNMMDNDNEDSTAENLPALKSQDVRPVLDKRVILLSGPPGVGKTTMAHIIAKHAGYRAVEVNASDERTAAVLKQHVLRAMESGLSKVPNCIILDEIDGADAQTTISTLVEIIKEDIPPKTGKGHKPFLRRPIIFICNQKYAAALRPLLPYAQQFEVSPPSAERLISRIRSILAAEGISVSGGSSLLNQLVQATGGDIRSALFSLQFASSRAKALHRTDINWNSHHAKRPRSVGVIDISTVLTATLDGTRSLKDDRSDIVATLNAIFRKPVQRGDKEIERILNMVDSFGDATKTLDHIFSNILQVPFVDPMFDRCWSAFEWLSYSDILRSFKTHIAMTNTVEHFSVQRCHIPTAACAVHYLCRIEKRPNLNFSPREMLDAVYKTEAHAGLLSKFMDGLTPRLQNMLMGTNLVTDLIPYVLWLLSAGVGSSGLNRAVSTVDMLMKNERVAFQRHCDILRSLGLNYVKDDSFDKGHALNAIVHYRLNPDISNILKFNDLSRENIFHRNEIPTVIKQLLAHAVHLEEVKHRGDMIISPRDTKLKRVDHEKNASSRPLEKSKAMDESIPITKDVPKNFLGAFAVKSKAAQNAKKAALIGIEKSSTKVQLSNTGSGIPLENTVKFKYQKGFTQAVRMPCSARDFM